MRIQIFGLTFETPRVHLHLRDPWRSTALEHRIFDNLRKSGKLRVDEDVDGQHVIVDDVKNWKSALQAVIRTLKAWQEEASPVNGEERLWCFVVEGNVTSNGYDIHGQPATIQVFVRLGLIRGGGPVDPDKGDEIDLDGFSIQIDQSPEA